MCICVCTLRVRASQGSHDPYLLGSVLVDRADSQVTRAPHLVCTSWRIRCCIVGERFPTMNASTGEKECGYRLCITRNNGWEDRDRVRIFREPRIRERERESARATGRWEACNSGPETNGQASHELTTRAGYALLRDVDLPPQGDEMEHYC